MSVFLESLAKTKVEKAKAIVAAAVKSLGDTIRVPITMIIAIAQIIRSLCGPLVLSVFFIISSDSVNVPTLSF